MQNRKLQRKMQGGFSLLRTYSNMFEYDYLDKMATR